MCMCDVLVCDVMCVDVLQVDHKKFSSDSTLVNLFSVLQQLSVRVKVCNVSDGYMPNRTHISA